MWFDDDGFFNQWRTHANRAPALVQEVGTDEYRLFDVLRIGFMLAEERESSLENARNGGTP
jgi:hypothetical protein